MECFTVYADEIKNRIDPLYYISDVFHILKKSIFEIKTIGDVVFYIKTGFPAGDNLQSQDEVGIIQIRPTNINEDNTLIFEKNVFIKHEIAQNRKSELLKKGEILFNNTNSQELVGKTAFFYLDGEYFCSNHITRIKVNEKLILPKYLWLLLNQYQRNKVFFILCTNWNNQSGVNIELLKTIKIPIPPIEKQEKIISLYETALDSKKFNEIKAQQLLDSINDYILDELGINLPELKDRVIYVVNSEEMKNKRADACYYQPKFEEIEKAIKKGTYPTQSLSKLAKKVVRRFKPLQNVEYKYIQLGCINRIQGSIKETLSITIPNIPSRAQQVAKENEIIFSLSLPQMNAHALVSEEYSGCPISSGFTIIKTDTCNSLYILSVLRSKPYLILYEKYITGAGLFLAISNEDLFNIKIPLPSLAVQNKIAEEVKRRMQKTEQLQKKAREELEKAKKETEKIVLGG